MPFPDAKYPPERVVMDAWRLALEAIRSDCERVMTHYKPDHTPPRACVQACWDCATTALNKEAAP
jgi:hypothetical protein